MPENTVVISAEEYEMLIRSKVILELVKRVMEEAPSYAQEPILRTVLGQKEDGNAE